MERVVFLVEKTGVQIRCLLNPESVVMRRSGGVHERWSVNGPIIGARMKDDPLLCTGGGRTELTLDLLFDVTMGGSSIVTEDVRELTRPLVELTEAITAANGCEAAVVRFLWGKYWNIPGVITAVAERLEYFTPQGAPQRSWLRMRFVRTTDHADEGINAPPKQPVEQLVQDPDVKPEQLSSYEVLGTGGLAERLDEIAFRVYGDCRFWKLIAETNNIDDPLEVPPGLILQISPRFRTRRASG